MSQDDLIMAFFPCTRFESNILLGFRGELYHHREFTDIQKLEYDLKLHKELSENYELVTKLVIIAIKKGFRMCLENPYDVQHYLTRYWALKPSVIDKDRSVNGDYYKKPTQYWFIGFEPKNNFVFEPLEYVPRFNIERADMTKLGYSKDTARSMIHPQYASRFIKQYLIEYETDTSCLFGFNPYQE